MKKKKNSNIFVAVVVVVFWAVFNERNMFSSLIYPLYMVTQHWVVYLFLLKRVIKKNCTFTIECVSGGPFVYKSRFYAFTPILWHATLYSHEVYIESIWRISVAAPAVVFVAAAAADTVGRISCLNVCMLFSRVSNLLIARRAIRIYVRFIFRLCSLCVYFFFTLSYGWFCVSLRRSVTKPFVNLLTSKRCVQSEFLQPDRQHQKTTIKTAPNE